MAKYCQFPVCQCDVTVGLGCPYEPYDTKEPVHQLTTLTDQWEMSDQGTPLWEKLEDMRYGRIST